MRGHLAAQAFRRHHHCGSTGDRRRHHGGVHLGGRRHVGVIGGADLGGSGGDQVTAGNSFGEVESTKSVSDLYAPVSGKVSAVNGDLEANPQLVNTDPYGAGWLLDIQVESSDVAALESAKAWSKSPLRL